MYKEYIITHNYPTKDDSFSGIFINDENTDNSEIIHLPFGESLVYAKIYKLIWYLVKSFFRIGLLKKDYNVTLHWWIPLGMIVSLFFKDFNVVCHGTDMFWLEKFPFVSNNTHWFAKRVKSWRCVSYSIREILLRCYPFLDTKKIFVKPMPIGKEFIDKNLKRDNNLIVSVGSLIKRKNFKTLIQSVVHTNYSFPEKKIKLYIYGEGPEFQNLNNIIKRYNHTRLIQLKGVVDRKELVNVYNKASLFILLSWDEGYGLVLKEAEACGCPTMATKGDGKEADYMLPESWYIQDVSSTIRKILG